MDNVYFYTRMHGWERPIIDYFKEKKYWKKVIISQRFPKDEGILKDGYITEYLPQELYKKIMPYLPQFIDMESRTSALSLADYREYNYHDYLNLFNIYTNAYYNFYKKNKIDLYIANRLPHLGFDLIAFLVAKEMRIRTVFMEQSHFPNRFFIFDDYFDFGLFESSKKIGAPKFVSIDKKHEKELNYMRQEKLTMRQKLRKFYANNPFIRMMSQLTHKRYRGQAIYRYDLKKTFQKNRVKYTQPIDLKDKFVYFALHLQPEKTTSSGGGEYVDQLLAIERLSEFVPDNVKIYVKENPIQTYMMRGAFFYDRLRSINKVIMVPNDTNTYDLIKNSLFVSTVTGTVGWEAISGGKNVLIFGWGTWYRTLPGVFYFEDNPEYQQLLAYEINHKELEKGVNKLLEKTGKGVVFPIEDYKESVSDFSSDRNKKDVVASIQRYLYNASGD